MKGKKRKERNNTSKVKEGEGFFNLGLDIFSWQEMGFAQVQGGLEKHTDRRETSRRLKIA